MKQEDKATQELNTRVSTHDVLCTLYFSVLNPLSNDTAAQPNAVSPEWESPCAGDGCSCRQGLVIGGLWVACTLWRFFGEGLRSIFGRAIPTAVDVLSLSEADCRRRTGAQAPVVSVQVGVCEFC